MSYINLFNPRNYAIDQFCFLDKINDENQYFKVGQIVRINFKLPAHMSNYPYDELAVIEHTHHQKYNSLRHNEYSLIIIDHNLMPKASYSWYTKNQLTLTESDTKIGLSIIDHYRNDLF